MNNYKMLISYDGTRYSGWQIQGNTTNTIQGKIQQVLECMLGEKVEIHGSGRTDAGVHASGQVANFKTGQNLRTQEILEYCNQYLPKDIAVMDVVQVEERFHSRLHAVEKTYQYRIWTGIYPNVFERKYLTEIREPLDVAAMRKAADYLVGSHDFRSFCGNKHFKKSSLRVIYKIDIWEKENEILLEYTGNGFLQNMIRILSGTLVEVGLGKRNPEEIQEILEAKDRSRAGYTMPPQGLCLTHVGYGDGNCESTEQL